MDPFNPYPQLSAPWDVPHASQQSQQPHQEHMWPVCQSILDKTANRHHDGSSSYQHTTVAPSLYGAESAMMNLMKPRAQSADVDHLWMLDGETDTQRTTSDRLQSEDDPSFSSTLNNKNKVNNGNGNGRSSNINNKKPSSAQQRALKLSDMYELAEQKETDLNRNTTFQKKTKNFFPSRMMTTLTATATTAKEGGVIRASQNIAQNSYRSAKTMTTMNSGTTAPTRSGENQNDSLSQHAPNRCRAHTYSGASPSAGATNSLAFFSITSSSSADDAENMPMTRDDSTPTTTTKCAAPPKTLWNRSVWNKRHDSTTTTTTTPGVTIYDLPDLC